MSKFSKYMSFCALLLFTCACTKLEEDLIGEITNDITIPGPPVTISDPEPSIYAGFHQIGLANHGSYYSIQELTTDEMFIGVRGSDWYSNGAFVKLHQHTYTPSNEYIYQAWSGLYSSIVLLNHRLLDPSLSPAYIPEIRAIRAYFYLCLMDLFGRVKIVTETNQNPPQVNRVEVFEFVEQELLGTLGISEVVPGMDFGDSPIYHGDNVYRLNHYGVLGLLARLYLNSEVYTGVPRYDKAEIVASYIIDSGRFQLCGAGCSVQNLGKRAGVEDDPPRLEGYAAVFAPNNEGNPEHIFAVNFDEVTGPGMNFSQMNLHYASQLSWRFDQQPWNGYATLEEFYNSYEEHDARKKSSFLAGLQLDFSGSAVLDYNYDDDDIQLDYTPYVNALQPNTLRQAGARPAKFSFKLFGQADMNNDFPLLRLGEMYLIRAEAKARQSGNWEDAEHDINVLRTRAGVDNYSGNLTEAAFLAERGREMFQETVRRTDLIRFGRYNDTWWEKPASEPFRNIFPIPLQIVDDASLVQNPGY